MLLLAGRPGTNSYQYTDAASNGGIVYYRLKLYAKNGAVTYTNVLVFRMEAGLESFKVYSTVVNDNATLRISAAKSEQTFFYALLIWVVA